MAVIAKGRVLQIDGKSVKVEVLDDKGKRTGTQTARLREDIKLKKGDFVMISFGVVVDKLRK
jgi:translation initiation factor IF-1